MGIHDLSQIWPEWRIEGAPLGAGSFGTVYKAVRKDSLVESYAAIKVISIPKSPSEINDLRSEGLETDRAVTSYLQGIVNDCVSEIQLMESLKGIQNIVSVEDYKVVKKEDGIGWDIYIRMELLTPLTTYITKNRLSERDVIKLGIDICSALEVCGKKGIIHRDIKPENIFVNEFGDFKLGDFGIARKLEGQISNLSRKGTPNYMAPEVANSKDYDSRVDTYSLGIVLYRYLNKNRLPFLNTEEQITSPVERENASTKRLRGEKLPPPSEASARMAEAVLRACAYNPNARFQDATQMKRALQSILDAPPPRPRRRVGKIIATVAAILVLLGSLGALYTTGVLSDAITAVQTIFTENKSQDNNEADGVDNLNNEQIASIIAEADSLIQIQDYEGALAVIQAGLAEYPDSQELVSYGDQLTDQLKVSTLESAQALVEANDYVSAMALLQEAIAKHGELPEYLAAYETYQSEYTSTVRAEALEEITRLSDSEDYLGALLAIEDVISTLGEDEELISQKTVLEVAYINQIIKQANDLLLLEDYDNADRVVNAAMQHFPNNELLLSESQRIQNARPVYLLDVASPYKKSNHYSDRSTLSMGGKSYLSGFTCMGYGKYNEGNEAYFNLDGKYSMISFTAGIVSDRGRQVTFLFYADGELVYKFTMKSGDRPGNHVFNIVGCKQFRICVYDGCSTRDKSGMYGIADIKVKRNTSGIEENTPKLTENQVYLLNEMKPYKTPSHYEDTSVLSMGGQNFTNGFTCMGYGAQNVGNKVYFNLDGKYSRITFTAGIVIDRGLDVTYRFYTDGKLAYELKLGESDLATTHSFNVEGCKQLMISIYDKKQSPDASGTYGIAEIIMDKSSSYTDSEAKYELKAGEHYLLSTIKPHTTPTRYNDIGNLNMGGKHYSNGFSCMGYGDSKGNQTHFTLDGKYKQISFTAGIVLDRELKVTFRFFADGKKVYEFTMGEADLPTEHSFSVEGCSELVICVIDRQRGADTSGTYGLGNIIITE